MSLSIVIPAYNEAKRLPETLERIQACFAGVAGDMALGEVIVVDDGSRDGTIAVAENFTGRLPMRVIALPTNRGKGAAVRTGMLAAAGDRVLFYDADGATPPEEILRLGAAMNSSGADVAIGSRVNPDEEIVTMSAYRRFIGRVYHALCAPLVPGIHDTACGCKLFTAAASRDLFSRQSIDRFAFDVEILFLAHRLGYRIEEMRVAWTAVDGSKVRVVRDGLNMFRSVVGLYLAWLKAPPAQRGSAR